jgi:hypothetical protein
MAKKDINCVSISYDEWRLYGVVWKYDEYTALLENLLEDNNVILGGDILLYDENRELTSSGCGWYYQGESVLDSNIEAQKYLSSIKKWSEKEALYISIVLKQA